MVNLILVLLAMAYALYVFLAESFNPLQTPYEERDLFLHKSGWLVGSVLLLSPLSLTPFPAVGFWPQLRQCLMLAVAVLIFISLLYTLRALIRLAKQRTHKAKINSAITEDEAMLLRAAAALPETVQNAIQTQQSINIDADRSIEPDLAAELAIADQEIKLSELSTEESELLDRNLAVLEPLPAISPPQEDEQITSLIEVDDEISGAIISDAVIVEASTSSNSTQTATASDGTPDHPAMAHSALGILQMQSNSDQLKLVDSFAGAMKGGHELNSAISRVYGLSSRGRALNSKINAETQRKLIHTNARIDKTGKKLKHEESVRQTLEIRVAQQSSELEKSKQQLDILKTTLALRQQQLESNNASLDKARDMARSAAKLAREAAVSQQRARSIAEHEKVLRQKVETRTRQAIGIAKNAITALAAEEKKKKHVDSLN